MSISRRIHILETGVKLASKEGLKGLTIGMLAKAVGMSKSGLFAHFNSKDNLQTMVFKMAADDFTQKVLRKAFQVPRGEPRLRAILDNIVYYFDSESEGLPGGTILMKEALNGDHQNEQLKEVIQNVQKELIRDLEKAVYLCIEQGHFRDDVDVSAFVWKLYSFVLGYHHFKKVLGDEDAEKHLRNAFEVEMRAVKSGNQKMPGIQGKPRLTTQKKMGLKE